MKDIGYGKDYKYAHDFNGSFAEQEFLPKEIIGKSYITQEQVVERKKFVLI